MKTPVLCLAIVVADTACVCIPARPVKPEPWNNPPRRGGIQPSAADLRPLSSLTPFWSPDDSEVFLTVSGGTAGAWKLVAVGRDGTSDRPVADLPGAVFLTGFPHAVSGNGTVAWVQLRPGRHDIRITDSERSLGAPDPLPGILGHASASRRAAGSRETGQVEANRYRSVSEPSGQRAR
jgi:hypothetical protein